MKHWPGSDTYATEMAAAADALPQAQGLTCPAINPELTRSELCLGLRQ